MSFFFHTMLGYCYLTPVWDISILHPLFRLHQCYPTLPNSLFMTTTTKKMQLNKLPQTTILFRTIDGTICFNNDNIQTHVLGSICVRRDGI